MLQERPGMHNLLSKVAKSSSRKLYVADETRLARKLSVQEQAIELLKARGIELVSACDPHLFTDESPEGAGNHTHMVHVFRFVVRQCFCFGDTL